MDFPSRKMCPGQWRVLRSQLVITAKVSRIFIAHSCCHYLKNAPRTLPSILPLSNVPYTSNFIMSLTFKGMSFHGPKPQCNKGSVLYYQRIKMKENKISVHSFFFSFHFKFSQTRLNKWVELTLVLLNPDIPCLCKQSTSRSADFWRSQLIWICTVSFSMWICINNLDDVIWLADNKWVWHLNLFSMTYVMTTQASWASRV